MFLDNKLKHISRVLFPVFVLNGCIAPQTYSWKTESVVSTRYEKVDEETAKETRYKISPSISENGILSLRVKKQEYDIDYEVLQPIESQRQQQYAYGRGKRAATWTNIGLGTVALGTILEVVTTTKTERCDYGQNAYDPDDNICYEHETQGSVPAHLVLTTGLLTTSVSSLFYWGNYSKRARPTRNYQTIEVELETRERKPEAEHFLAAVPAIGATVEVTSSYFTLNGTGHNAIMRTNVMGNVTLQLAPSSQIFVYSLDQLATIDAAQQLSEAGYRQEVYLPLLEQAATPVAYEVHVQTRATDGKNAEVTIPVKGYEVSQQALEKVVMSL